MLRGPILDPGTNLREVSPSGEARITFSGIDKWSQTPSGAPALFVSPG